MKSGACIALLALVLPALAVAGNGERRLLVFGDSLSAAYGMAPGQGWVAALAARLDERGAAWSVVNASLSGETTSGGAARLDAVLKRYQPQLVILELGGNDGLRGLSLEQTRANLEAMIRRIRADAIPVLLLGMRLPPNYGPVYTRRFEAIFADLARVHELSFVPFFLEGVATVPEMMQADGIHPRAAAQGRLLDNVWPRLGPLLKVHDQ